MVDIKAILFVYCCVVFYDVGDFAAVFVDVVCGPISNVSETLNCKSLVTDTCRAVTDFVEECFCL
jgi:hypothetical protein